MFGVGTHQPFKIASHGCELILVRPEHERYANHVKARQQQIALVGRTVAEQQSLDKEEVLEVAEVDQDPRVERFHVDGRIEYVFGIKRQAGGELGYCLQLASLDVSIRLVRKGLLGHCSTHLS